METAPRVQFRRLRPDAGLPYRTDLDLAEYDLCCPFAVTVPAGSAAVLPTGLAWECSPGWVGDVAGRASLRDSGVSVVSRVLDPGYRGEIMVAVVNRGHDPFTFVGGGPLARVSLRRDRSAVAASTPPPSPAAPLKRYTAKQRRRHKTPRPEAPRFAYARRDDGPGPQTRTDLPWVKGERYVEFAPLPWHRTVPPWEDGPA